MILTLIILLYPIYRLILLNIERDQDLFVSIEEEIIKQFLVNNGYLGKLIHIRCLMVSTDQADSHCFYFRIS